MSRFKSKQQLVDDIVKERAKLEALLESIPKKRKTEVVVDGMSVKDFLAHRTEWGRMLLSWYETVKKGGIPAVPHEKYKWNQLKQLNADIFETYKRTPLEKVERDFKKVHDDLFAWVKRIPEQELLSRFVGASDLASYVNSSTAAHYRSAYKHINKWWKAEGD